MGRNICIYVGIKQQALARGKGWALFGGACVRRRRCCCGCEDRCYDVVWMDMTIWSLSFTFWARRWLSCLVAVGRICNHEQPLTFAPREAAGWASFVPQVAMGRSGNVFLGVVVIRSRKGIDTAIGYVFSSSTFVSYSRPPSSSSSYFLLTCLPRVLKALGEWRLQREQAQAGATTLHMSIYKLPMRWKWNWV